ncbi:MAG: hypothetical protein IPP51_13420 [Bacteroidetes bacterium]|nr:hypothetical protein [Bacteroidota bacterium]
MYCIPQESITLWTINNPTAYLDSLTLCARNFVRVTSTGWYTYTAHIERNDCDTDFYDLSDSIYVEVVPISGGTVTLTISGDTTFCPGDSVLLIAGGSTASYHWSNGSVGDSIYISIPDIYSVSSTMDSINANGCHIPIIGGASHTVTTETLPVITATPDVICPNDSVQLSCSNNPGASYSWQGTFGYSVCRFICRLGKYSRNLFLHTNRKLPFGF